MFRWFKLKYRAWRWPETMDCEGCAGTGIVHWRRKEDCPACRGTGVMR